eukprot:8211666-Alexandrium_andersonii.AAC.1
MPRGGPRRGGPYKPEHATERRNGPRGNQARARAKPSNAQEKARTWPRIDQHAAAQETRDRPAPGTGDAGN